MHYSKKYTFQSDQRIVNQKTIEDTINLSKAGKEIADIKASKNYNDLEDLYQNGFNWKVGKYSIRSCWAYTAIALVMKK